MSRIFGVYGPTHPRLKTVGHSLIVPLSKALSAYRKFYTLESAYAQERACSLQQKMRRGEPVYLLGLGPTHHNSGVALVEVSLQRGVRLLYNNEEERYTAIKHCAQFPERSIEVLRAQMSRLGIRPEDIHACLANYDYVKQCSLDFLLEEVPQSLSIVIKGREANVGVGVLQTLFDGPKRLGRQLGLKEPLPIIGMRHHDNHAYFSYAVSPFAQSKDPVIVAVLDGMSDDGAISLYLAQKGELSLLHANQSNFDSLGLLYSYLSSTQGGWPILSSEGRYMGAAAWGNNDRLTNPYYRQLRQLVYFGSDGQVYLNRALANWQRKGVLEPYTPALSEILGPPIPLEKMWDPDAVLRVEDVEHAEITQERVDKAAATQLLFEDVLFHIIGYLIQRTGSNKLVLAGGCALNCIANMRLLEHFDETYYERYVGCKGKRLHLWVPPTPGDAGVTMGAAYHFALVTGNWGAEPLQHAFYCGLAPTRHEICEALEADEEIGYVPIGDVSMAEQRNRIADLAASIVAKDGVIGVVQGIAETGPRALGHRSIFANPCNPRTREILNQLVKYREPIRPLAPMVTYEAAQRWFELSAGASDANYNAYNYMVLTAQARRESQTVIPAVIHKDGTGRIQIVREEMDPFTYAYLKAMGRRVGVEVSVNTSLNVGSPIAQTPPQALLTLKRSKGMDGLFLFSEEGEAFLAWHKVSVPPKDGGRRLQQWLQEWKQDAGKSVG